MQEIRSTLVLNSLDSTKPAALSSILTIMRRNGLEGFITYSTDYEMQNLLFRALLSRMPELREFRYIPFPVGAKDIASMLDMKRMSKYAHVLLDGDIAGMYRYLSDVPVVWNTIALAPFVISHGAGSAIVGVSTAGAGIPRMRNDADTRYDAYRDDFPIDSPGMQRIPAIIAPQGDLMAAYDLTEVSLMARNRPPALMLLDDAALLFDRCIDHNGAIYEARVFGDGAITCSGVMQALCDDSCVWSSTTAQPKRWWYNLG